MTELPDELQVVIVHPVLRDAFVQWLDARGLHLFRIPVDTEDGLPTYGIGIKQELIDRLEREEN